MENIPIYIWLGFMYVLTDPSPLVSTILFRVATVARICHTFVYAIYVCILLGLVVEIFSNTNIVFF